MCTRKQRLCLGGQRNDPTQAMAGNGITISLMSPPSKTAVGSRVSPKPFHVLLYLFSGKSPPSVPEHFVSDWYWFVYTPVAEYFGSGGRLFVHTLARCDALRNTFLPQREYFDERGNLLRKVLERPVIL